MGEDMRSKVEERYAGVARAVRSGGGSCCGEDGPGGVDLASGSYTEDEKDELPRAASEASLGCGNPVFLADLSPGEVVLDLGSGGGIDVLLSARRVSPGGKAYGLDMTDEMLALARENQEKAGVRNVEFLKGEIEKVPLPEDHVDVVISNCVINLSTDKPQALGEAFRVLRPGGRLAISDMIFLGEKANLPEKAVRSVELWAGCISGALEKPEYEKILLTAGFTDVSIEVTHTYGQEVFGDFVEGSGCCGGREPVEEALDRVLLAGASIRARKPEAG
ncbi:MAG: arsenite methyltransferase [Rubrobacteraceae bacterium]